MENIISSERVLHTFLDLVRFDNPSGQEADVVAYLHRTLTELGLEVEQDASLNLLARLPGKGVPLMLNGHTDCVNPCVGVRPVVVDGVVYSSGDTVLGADDLAGVAAIIEGVRRILESGKPHRAAELLFTTQEEIGLRGAAAFDYSKLQAHEGVILDMLGNPGGICVGAPSQNNLTAVIVGKAAHAGVEPEKGINAIQVAAEAIAAMTLGRIDHETTANIGTIHGGQATNIVPNRVELQGEIRSHSPARLEAQSQAMVDALHTAAARYAARVDITLTNSYQAYRLDEHEPVVTLVATAWQRLGIEPFTFISGGGSDANVFSEHGMRVANLSIGYRAIHTVDEHIAVADLERAAQLVAVLLEV